MAMPEREKKISVDYLKDVSAWVSFAHDLNQLLELILETGTRVMGAMASSLLLLDQKTKKLYFKVTTGDKKEAVKDFEVRLGQGIAGYVAQTGTPLLIDDVSKDPRWYRHISDQIGFDTRSIICVPMKTGGKIIGAIEFINKIGGGAFSDDDLGLLAVFADLAALAIINARKFQQVERENKGLKRELDLNTTFVGESRAAKDLLSDALKVAASDAGILILGESGTGKELLARMIHRHSPRRDRFMMSLNCAAIQDSLLEEELFGSERGTAADAGTMRAGKFERADESTLFLDEIGEMGPVMQTKLLRVLQDGVFYRVGGSNPISANVRIICAANKDLEKNMSKGLFREDLYYRLNVVTLRIPPLRERKEDVVLIAEHFVRIYNKHRGGGISISPAAVKKLMAYGWPGNVRELKNMIERAVVMGNGRQIRPEDLPMTTRNADVHQIPAGRPLREAVDAFKRRYIAAELKETEGNQKLAARRLGIQRTYLSRLISMYGLKKTEH